ncbi:MAG TPA: hypothetical protein VN673_08390 [Clostridia bacterium]|nr:hypothetical protein [Clostridia bacterium]
MNAAPNAQTSPEMTTRPPRLLTPGAVMRLSAQGLLLLVPALLSALFVVSLLPFGKMTFLVPLLILLASMVFLPFGFGNAYATRLVHKLDPQAGKSPDTFIVQLTLTPRLRSGLSAQMEDADDLGCLKIETDRLVYHGDSVQLVLPFASVTEIKRRNLGLRGMFLYGSQTLLVVPGLPGVRELQFGERSSLILPSSRKAARIMFERLKQALRITDYARDH